MNEVIKKYAPKVVTTIETIEADKMYRLKKSVTYDVQIVELNNEIDVLTKKTHGATEAAKDSIYKKIEELTIRKIGLTQLRDSMVNRDVAADADEIANALESDKVLINKRNQELQTKITIAKEKLSKAENEFEDELYSSNQERDELNRFVRDITRQINELRSASKPKDEFID